jgi:hypothetical protein
VHVVDGLELYWAQANNTADTITKWDRSPTVIRTAVSGGEQQMLAVGRFVFEGTPQQLQRAPEILDQHLGVARGH